MSHWHPRAENPRVRGRVIDGRLRLSKGCASARKIVARCQVEMVAHSDREANSLTSGYRRLAEIGPRDEDPPPLPGRGAEGRSRARSQDRKIAGQPGALPVGWRRDASRTGSPEWAYATLPRRHRRHYIRARGRRSRASFALRACARQPSAEVARPASLYFSRFKLLLELATPHFPPPPPSRRARSLFF
jgi:hypothetical protein